MTYPNSPPQSVFRGTTGFPAWTTNGTPFKASFGSSFGSFGASFGDPTKSVLGTSGKMLNNVSVYTVADKYGIGTLKALARSKFEALAKTDCLPTKFATIASIVFNSTPSSDKGLRDIVTNKSMAHLDTLLKDPAFSKVMQEEAQLPIDLLCRKHLEGTESGKQTSSVMTSYEQKLATSEATIRMLRMETAKLEAAKANLRNEMVIKDRLLKGAMSCRHCARAFEGEYKVGEIGLRCKHCNTRT